MAEKDAAEKDAAVAAAQPEDEVAYPIDEHFADVSGQTCPVLYALGIVGQKWKLPILWFLHKQEGTRYNELKRQVTGITNTMLTKSLRELEEAGLVRREVRETVPPQVSYFLTQNGRALLPALNEIYRWGAAQMEREGS